MGQKIISWCLTSFLFLAYNTSKLLKAHVVVVFFPKIVHWGGLNYTLEWIKVGNEMMPYTTNGPSNWELVLLKNFCDSLNVAPMGIMPRGWSLQSVPANKMQMHDHRYGLGQYYEFAASMLWSNSIQGDNYEATHTVWSICHASTLWNSWLNPGPDFDRALWACRVKSHTGPSLGHYLGYGSYPKITLTGLVYWSDSRVNWNFLDYIYKIHECYKGIGKYKCNSRICISNTVTFHILWMNFRGQIFFWSLSL